MGLSAATFSLILVDLLGRSCPCFFLRGLSHSSVREAPRPLEWCRRLGMSDARQRDHDVGVTFLSFRLAVIVSASEGESGEFRVNFPGSHGMFLFAALSSRAARPEASSDGK